MATTLPPPRRHHKMPVAQLVWKETTVQHIRVGHFVAPSAAATPHLLIPLCVTKIEKQAETKPETETGEETELKQFTLFVSSYGGGKSRSTTLCYHSDDKILLVTGVYCGGKI